MITLSNVGKTYVSKSKVKVEALKDVSIKLGASGMTFILGKSGSGKSTLLNLLGGLDKPTTGSITVDGADMQSFKQADYESYRNAYVGFVFQEYNLLDDFNVKDNVALALQLSKDVNVEEKVADALKQVGLNEEYLTRRVGELSGGEKQRVAIARAIVKNSKMILADEPTGNLDSETGESIWNILKNLSNARLVVVVSHDRESAEKYSDRIIEISDGKVIADNGKAAEQSATDNAGKTRTNLRSSLSFATRLKMGYNNLNLRKGKTVGVILVAILSILSILITQMALSFSPEATLADYMLENNVDYFTVGQGYIDQLDGSSFSPYSRKPIYHSTQQYIAENAKYIKNCTIESKQDILDIGLTFVGEALEIDDNSFYLTSNRMDTNVYSNGQVKVNGEYTDIIKELHPVEFLVGKEVRLGFLNGPGEFILAGVIDTENIVNPSAIVSDMYGFFYNKNFKGHKMYDTTYNESLNRDKIMYMGDALYNKTFKISYINDYRESLSSREVVLTPDGICDGSNAKELADNEIVITYEFYEEIFAKNSGMSKWSYISSDMSEVRKMPPELGKTISLKFGSSDNGEIIADYGEVKLAGIIFAENELSELWKSIIYTSYGFGHQICSDLKGSTILIQTSSVKNLKEFTTTLRRNYLGAILDAGTVETTVPMGDDGYYTSIADECYSFEYTMTLVSVIFITLAGVLMIVFVLMLINLISYSIASRKKEIGILSAIGASNRDITGIFLLETSIVAAISFVFVVIMAFVSASVLNVFLSRGENLAITVPFLGVNVWTLVLPIVLCFGLMLLTALIPVRKIIKLKPIDAIRVL